KKHLHNFITMNSKRFLEQQKDRDESNDLLPLTRTASPAPAMHTPAIHDTLNSVELLHKTSPMTVSDTSVNSTSHGYLIHPSSRARAKQQHDQSVLSKYR